MRTPIPIWVDGLYGLKAVQVLSGWISLSDPGLLAELSHSLVDRYYRI
jgi:hypothetical protein